jgi:hypothetical protein
MDKEDKKVPNKFFQKLNKEDDYVDSIDLDKENPVSIKKYFFILDIFNDLNFLIDKYNSYDNRLKWIGMAEILYGPCLHNRPIINDHFIKEFINNLLDEIYNFDKCNKKSDYFEKWYLC